MSLPFASKVDTFTDHKPLVEIFRNDVTLLQGDQCILLHIHQQKICILYKPGSELYTADWLS